MNKQLPIGGYPLLLTLLMGCLGWLNPITAQTVNIYVEDIQAEVSENVAVNVRVKNFVGVAGAQFSVNWNPDELSYVGLDNLALSASEGSNFNVQKLEEGKLGYLVADMSLEGFDLDDEAILFTVNFGMLLPNDAQSSITFGEDPISQVVSDTANQVIETLFEGGMVRVGNPVGTEDTYVDDPQFTASPNPFFENVALRYFANRPGPATLSIYDVKGERLLNRKEQLNYGENLLRLTAGDFPATGVYLLRLATREGNYHRKLVFSGAGR